MKKIIISLIVIIFINISYSQVSTEEIIAINLLPPKSLKHNDLSFLKKELNKKKVVMLGEETHMYGNIFAMKARVIEYLHQELGFTTIAMEAPMYDIWKMNKNGFTKKGFNDAIFGVWSSSLEFQRLVNYVDENNLKIIGFDSQINNTSQFIEDFFDYCDNKKFNIKLDEDDLGIIIEGVLENRTFEEDDIKYSVYEKEIKRIIKLIKKLKDTETNYYWLQFTKNIIACSQDAYFNKEEILTMDFGNKNDNIRDKQMADNLLTYIYRNPKEKIICWADNIHVMVNNSSIKKPIAKDFIPMGSYIKNELNNEVYSLATIHANDSILDPQINKWFKTKIKINSFEYELDNLNKPYLFITSNQQAMRSIKETRLLNFIEFTKAKVNQLHDGYLFFQNATLAKKRYEKIDTSKKISKNIKEKQEVKKIKKIVEGQNVLLKGQILDKKSKEPVPFVTLILKKEEIYSVADENGFYELPVKKKMIENVSVAISSIGYEQRIIKLKELNSKIYLNPKFEELAEVVITGRLSPKAVLKKAVFKKKKNHPIKPFNFYRYAKVLDNKNNTTELDFEIISKDCDYGYMSKFVVSRRVEQIKWNIKKNRKRYKNTSQVFIGRENAIRYANILHKRKYKKFKLSFIKSDDPKDDDFYIISFKTERNKWNYTNREYPTKYSGRVYINRDNFAIVKVIENWETSLEKNEISKYFKGYHRYKNIIKTTIKEENICYYSNIANDGKYYATRYFTRSYSEIINKNYKKENRIFERDSYLFDFELKNVEEIEYYEYNNKEENSLKRVKYDEDFWNSFVVSKEFKQK